MADQYIFYFGGKIKNKTKEKNLLSTDCSRKKQLLPNI